MNKTQKNTLTTNPQIKSLVVKFDAGQWFRCKDEQHDHWDKYDLSVYLLKTDTINGVTVGQYLRAEARCLNETIPLFEVVRIDKMGPNGRMPNAIELRSRRREQRVCYPITELPPLAVPVRLNSGANWAPRGTFVVFENVGTQFQPRGETQAYAYCYFREATSEEIEQHVVHEKRERTE